jgi:hypothetical protein
MKERERETIRRKLKTLLKKILPQSFIDLLQQLNLYTFHGLGIGFYRENPPHFVKKNIFIKYALVNSDWVETGTYKGNTTRFLSKRFPHVYSIEPDVELYKKACYRFKGKNVTLFNGISENVLPKLLPKLRGNLNFWLDGHYSEGITFRGKKDCPIIDELNAIEINFDNFKKLSIFIDDVRLFLSSTYDYPSIDYLVDWTRRLDMKWRIVNDIFIIEKK